MMTRALKVVLGARAGYLLFGAAGALGAGAVLVNLFTPLPAAFRGLPLFCQWLVFDPRLPNGIGLSRGGKTLIY